MVWAFLIAHLVKNLCVMQETPVQFLGWEDPPGEGIVYPSQYFGASLMTQLVKNLLAMWDTWVRSLGWEDPLEKEKATHSRFWPREFHGQYSPWGHKESDTTFHFRALLSQVPSAFGSFGAVLKMFKASVSLM